jgi:hypothetical protein
MSAFAQKNRHPSVNVEIRLLRTFTRHKATVAPEATTPACLACKSAMRKARSSCFGMPGLLVFSLSSDAT